MTNSAYAAPVAKQQFTDSSGNFLNGGKLFVYLAGSTTKATTYADAQEVTPNTNPIVLDAEGRASVFLSPGTFYKFTLSPSTDTDPPTNAIWSVDNIGVSATPGTPYAVDTGTASAMVATFVGIPLTRTTGTSVLVKAANNASGASTFNATPAGGTAYGAIAIKDKAGADITNNGYVAGQVMLLTDDGTFWRTLF